jgi:hypothetical protein
VGLTVILQWITLGEVVQGYSCVKTLGSQVCVSPAISSGVRNPSVPRCRSPFRPAPGSDPLIIVD